VQEIIAETKCFAVFGNGERKLLHLVVGRPYRIDDRSWACPVQLEGLHEKIPNIVGGDSWQALGLAIGLIRQLLGYLVEEGGKLYWEEGGEEMFLKELFPQLKDSN
jgi:Domain of unknown function (DUF6968)